MNKIKKYLTFLLILSLIIILFKYNYILKDSVINGTTLWLTKVFPNLFIMFIINDLIINLNLLSSINKLINPIFNKIFNTTGSSSNVFLLSIFSGTPSSAFIIKEMLNNNKISLNDANKLIAFTFFGNPLFLYSILSLSFNNLTTIKIIIIHYITNIIIGLFFKNKDNLININYEYTNNNTSFFKLLPNSIKKSFDTLLMILGTIIFYMIITNLFTTIFTFNPILTIIIKGILEITQGLNSIPPIIISSIIKEIIAISIISFGGFAIHTQVLSIISDTKIKYKNFLIGRLLHTLIATSSYLFISLFITR